MVCELAELVDRQVSALGGARVTMVRPEQLFEADYRRDGHHRDPAGDPGLLNLTRPDITPRAVTHHLRPGRLAVVTGIAEHDRYAKTFIASAFQEKP